VAQEKVKVPYILSVALAALMVVQSVLGRVFSRGVPRCGVEPPDVVRERLAHAHGGGAFARRIPPARATRFNPRAAAVAR
jgi:hypothetical protein